MSNLISSKDKKKSREDIVWIDDGGNFRNTHLFCKTGEYFMENNLYTRHQPGSPEYDNFWITQEEKCREGVTIGEVSITGYNYFYLNYYMMQNTISDPLDPVKSKRVISRFPRFYRFQYNVFQIIDYIQKNGYNLSIIKPRGCGLSEIAASIGVRDYTFSTKENGKIVKHKKIFYFAADKDYLDRDGILTKCWSSMEFLSNYTDWFHARMKLDTKMHKRASLITQDTKIEVRTGGEIMGSVINSPDEIRGIRGDLILFEEAGSFKDLLTTYEIAVPSIKPGGSLIGNIMVWGTSNNVEKNLEGLKELIYNPVGYDILPFKNSWKTLDLNRVPIDIKDMIVSEDNPLSEEESSMLGNPVGYFIPYYDSMYSFMDSDGNSLRKEALDHIQKEREKNKSNKNDLNAYRNFIADHPVTIEEALMKSKSAFFNPDKLSEQFVNLKGNPDFKPERGNLVWKEMGNELMVAWEPSKDGKITVLETPIKFNGAIPPNLYIAGIDSIDFGIGNSSVGEEGSKFAMVVKKRAYSAQDPLANAYVAYVNYRPYDERDAYDLALKLSTYFNAKINLEMTRKEIIAYFRNPPKGLPSQEFRFVSQPKIIDDKVYSQNSKKFMKKEIHIGTRATGKINSYMDSLVKAYVQDYSDLIYFEDFLMELKDYDPSVRTKFDLIVALGLCEILDQDMEFQNIIVQIKEETQRKAVTEWGYYTDSRGYKKFGKRPSQNLDEFNFQPSPNPKINYIDRIHGH